MEMDISGLAGACPCTQHCPVSIDHRLWMRPTCSSDVQHLKLSNSCLGLARFCSYKPFIMIGMYLHHERYMPIKLNSLTSSAPDNLVDKPVSWSHQVEILWLSAKILQH